MRLKRLILRISFIQWVLTSVIPKIRFSIKPPEMTGGVFAEFNNILRPGDLVFSSDRSKLSSWLIPGDWDHVGVYIGNSEIVEAVQPVVRITSVFDFCHSSDVVGVARHPWLNLRYVINVARATIGRPYDTFFDRGNEALYCSELIALIDAMNELNLDHSDAVGMGAEYVTPDEVFLKARGVKISPV
jgi:cell wall-associated NlpC family hydrolase